MNANTVIDNTNLDAAPLDIHAAYVAHYRGEHRRAYLVTVYADGSQWHRTGYIAKTTGTRPGFLLVAREGMDGSSDLLTAASWEGTEHGRTYVAGIQYAKGGRYVAPGYNVRNIPADAGVEHDGIVVKPGRNRFTFVEDLAI
jgi:hypothetical protein